MKFQTSTHNPEGEQFIYLTAENIATIDAGFLAGRWRWEVIEELFPQLVGKVWCEISATNAIVYTHRSAA